MAEIYLAGGCFWGMEKYIASIRGVTQTQVGYANGKTANPTYQDVCHHNTGHAETVRVAYDPQTVPLPFLLSLFFDAIEPHVGQQAGRRQRHAVPHGHLLYRRGGPRRGRSIAQGPSGKPERARRH